MQTGISKIIDNECSQDDTHENTPVSNRHLINIYLHLIAMLFKVLTAFSESILY
jgi:hypothetical protein